IFFRTVTWLTSLWSQQCTAGCGKGNQTRTAVCLMDYVTDLPLGSCEGERPPEVTTCETGPCQNHLEWYTGPWGQVSKKYLHHLLHKQSLLKYENIVVDQAKCGSLPHPITAQVCSLKPCGVQCYVSAWSTYSRSCNGGYRVHEVRCLTDNTINYFANYDTFPSFSDPQCSDQYHKCMVVVQARLCIYPYYKSVCCASCSRAQKTYSATIQKNRIRR
uniref:PLAC domain-containing protein n=1 Tax=Neogobius melanostomus TaxID=47308 RepID=A0A8C6UNE7_9GOBI